MQHKRRSSRLKIFMWLVAVLLVAGIIGLMMTDIPAPQAPVVKELDAKAFLEPQPQQ